MDIVDRAEEEYVPPPPPPYTPFSGKAQSLVEEAPKAAKPFSKKPAQKDLKVDPNRPGTSLQIRLPDGSTREVTVNLDTKTADLVAYGRGLAGSSTALLVGGFPPRDIELQGKTVQEADLAGSLLICREP